MIGICHNPSNYTVRGFQEIFIKMSASTDISIRSLNSKSVGKKAGINPPDDGLYPPGSRPSEVGFEGLRPDAS